MIAGRIKKELKEICLLDQVYVKAEDGKQSVGNYIAQVTKRTALRLQSKASFVTRPRRNREERRELC